MDIISRKEAKKRGLIKYFLGTPCDRGHIDERYTSTSHCLECQRENGRWWYKNNLKKARAKTRSYDIKNRKIRRDKATHRRKNNREKYLAISQKHRENNRETLREKTREWRRNNPEKIEAYNQEHIEERRVTVRRRRARKRNAPGSHTAEDIKWLLEKQKYKCVYCKKSLKKKYHVDHIYPLSKGGGDGKDNLQILCPKCNLRKHAKDPIKFAQENGLLL